MGYLHQQLCCEQSAREISFQYQVTGRLKANAPVAQECRIFEQLADKGIICLYIFYI